MIIIGIVISNGGGGGSVWNIGDVPIGMRMVCGGGMRLWGRLGSWSWKWQRRWECVEVRVRRRIEMIRECQVGQ